MLKAIVGNRVLWLLLGYKMALDIAYIWYLYERHVNNGWWAGPYEADLTAVGYLTAWLACGTILTIFHETLQKPLNSWRYSEHILFFLLLFSVIPGLTMCGAGAFSWEYRGLFCLYWLFFFSLQKGVSSFPETSRFLEKEWLQQQSKRYTLFAISAVMVLTVTFVFFYYCGGTLFFSDLQSTEVYVKRHQFMELSLMFPFNYIMANAATVFLFLLLFFFEKRRYGCAGLVFLVWYMEFSCGVDKISVFSMLVGLFAYAGRFRLTKTCVLYLAIGILAIGMGVCSLLGKPYVLSFLFRTLFATNLLGYCYYDFFQIHVPVLYRFLGETTFDKGAIPSMIGAHYLESPMIWANNGLLGDSFMMAGVYGVIIGPILWAVYLYALNVAGSHLAWWVKVGTSIYWVTIMQNSSFTTSLLSHGGIAMIVLVYLCSDETNAGQAVLGKQNVDRNLSDVI